MRCTLSILIALAFGQSASACSCDELPPVAAELTRSEVVFAGRVMKLAIERRIAEPGLKREVEVLVSHFSVVDPIKGIPAEKKEIIIVTPFQGSACGFAFEIGVSYLVYASIFQGDLRTNICRRTRSFDAVGQKEAKEARELLRK